MLISLVALGMRSEENEPKYGEKRNKTENNFWFLLDDNAPAHRSVLVKDFLANNNVSAL